MSITLYEIKTVTSGQLLVLMNMVMTMRTPPHFWVVALIYYYINILCLNGNEMHILCIYALCVQYL